MLVLRRGKMSSDRAFAEACGKMSCDRAFAEACNEVS